MSYFVLARFCEAAASCDDARAAAVLCRLCAYHAAADALESPLWSGRLFPEELRAARGAIGTLSSELRPDMLALVDAFDIPDNVLMSAIGRRDGKVYEALFESAKASTLNSEWLHAGHKYLKPNLDLDFLRAGAIRSNL